MQISLVGKEIILTHGKTSVNFGNHDYDNRSLEGRKYSREEFIEKLNGCLFIELNEYWDNQTATWRNEVSRVYDDFVERIRDAVTESERSMAIREAVKLLVDTYHPYEAIEKHMSTRRIDTSDKVKEVYEDKLDMMSRRTTYIRSEYEELASLTIVLRSVYPIWNCAHKLKSNTKVGGDVTVEMELFQSLMGTEFSRCKPFMRLEEYVNALWEKFDNAKGKSNPNVKNSILSTVVAGIGSSDIPRYLLATSVVKRLAQREVNTFRDNGDLITCVFRRIDNELTSIGSKFANIRPKKFNSDGDDEDKTGYLETFRSRERVRRDLAMAAIVYCEKPRKMAKDIDPSVPAELVRTCLSSMKANKPESIYSEVFPYVQYVCSIVLQPRVVLQLNREAMMNAMAVTQAILIHWRLPQLAQMITSYPRSTEYIDGTVFEDVPVALKKELAEIYPCQMYPKGSSSKTPRCPGFTAVEMIADNFAGKNWELICSEKLANELNVKAGVHKAPRGIKPLTAELLIRVEKRKRCNTVNEPEHGLGRSIYQRIADATVSEVEEVNDDHSRLFGAE